MKAETVYKDVVSMIRAYGKADNSAAIAERVIENPRYAIAQFSAFYKPASKILLAAVEEMDKQQ